MGTSVQSGWHDASSGPGDFASLSPCRPSAPAFPLGKSETLRSPLGGSFSCNYEQTSLFEMFQETDRVCPWIGFNVQSENKSWGIRRARRPGHRAALSRSHLASPGQGCWWRDIRWPVRLRMA